MYERIRAFIEAKIRTIVAALTAGIFILWIVSNFVPKLSEWITQQQLLSVVLIALVAEILAITVELKRRATAERVHLCSKQSESSQELTDFIEKNHPKKADLIEVSSATVDLVLDALRLQNSHVRLLLQNPESGVTTFQKERIKQRIVELATVTFKNYESCEIRLYSVPCSLRGRLIGDKLVNVGWYVYSADNIGIYGHDNPLITASAGTREGDELIRMFNRAFDNLWNHPDTIPMANILPELGIVSEAKLLPETKHSLEPHHEKERVVRRT